MDFTTEMEITRKVERHRTTMINSLIKPLGQAETGERRYLLADRSERPKDIKCNFCNRSRVHEIAGDGMLKMWKGPDKCDCKEAIEYWKKYEEYTNRIEEECQELESREKRKIQVDGLINKSNLGRRFKDRTFQTFEINDNNKSSFDKAMNFANEFIKNEKEGKGLFCTGTVGTGKTHLVAAIANHLMYQENIPVKFGNVTTLLSEIKSTYDKNASESEAEII